MWEELRASMPSPSVPLTPSVCVFTNPEAPQVLSFWTFTEASLLKRDGIDHWPLRIDSTSSLPPLPISGGGKGEGVGRKVPTLQSHGHGPNPTLPCPPSSTGHNEKSEAREIFDLQ